MLALDQLDFFQGNQSKPNWENHPIFNEVEPRVFRRFIDFHYDNPHVFQLFRQFAKSVRASGFDRYSAKAVVERVRWHAQFETNGEPFKLSNDYTSCYARLLMIEEPEFWDFFPRQGRGE